MGGCPEGEIVDECMTFLFAGEDTTSSLLSFAVYELSRKSASARLLAVAACAFHAVAAFVFHAEGVVQ